MERLLTCILAVFLTLMATVAAIYTLVPLVAMGAVLIICFLLEVVQVSSAMMALAADSWPHYLPLDWWQWFCLWSLLVVHVGASLLGRWCERQEARKQAHIQVPPEV